MLRWSPPHVIPPAILYGASPINTSTKWQRSHTMYMMIQHILTHTQNHTGIHTCKCADSVGHWSHTCWVDKWWIGSRMYFYFYFCFTHALTPVTTIASTSFSKLTLMLHFYLYLLLRTSIFTTPFNAYFERSYFVWIVPTSIAMNKHAMFINYILSQRFLLSFNVTPLLVRYHKEQ